jgi:hypothetical protein
VEAIVPWWKRLFFSMASVAMPPATALLCAIAWKFLHGFTGMWIAVALLLYFKLSLFGWVLTLPFVLQVTDFRDIRWLMWLSIGCMLGPVLVGGVSLLPDSGLGPFSAESAGLSAAASGLATSIYILLFRRAQKKAAAGTSNDRL